MVDTASRSCMDSKAIEFLRGAASLAFFAVFGVGAVLLSPLMLVLHRIDRCQPLVRTVWRPLVWFFVKAGIVRVDRGNLPSCQGTVIVANHPSLIDVVLFVTMMPRTLYVAKHALRSNPVLAAIVRATSLPDDARLFDAAAPYLKQGWNVLVFPEGTRSPKEGLHPFCRGAAQLALRTSSPILCVGVNMSRRILAKLQPAWDVGSRCVTYSFRADAPTAERVREGESLHAAAVRVTGELDRRVKELLI